MPCRARGASHARGSGPLHAGGRRGASRCRASTARTPVPVVRACYTGRVPRLSPFLGLLYDPSVSGPLDHLTSPPYVVISELDREGHLSSTLYNIERVTCTAGVRP